jgi:hypothetical protein
MAHVAGHPLMLVRLTLDFAFAPLPRSDGDAFVAHFLVPVRRFWDDVVYTCSNQRMFCGVEHVRAWLAEAQAPLGAVLTPEQLWGSGFEVVSRAAQAWRSAPHP